ncbi:hypothetical protein A2348_03310 [Candidatus Uhrbacteria bacterium RIFOXYB12_FULL_58_10]|uniref:Carbohydrate kinase PfkB domain-containing protein n=1 Tax=Candidatus Uhrbacteria bacterium RIFOXYB2_FULL_57_15 TaxID=1802422 RepID=A0A1F7W6U7_9BACT|nr:MAG: hypothetical protein A2348_03310 [Candidatus Uhrbacteria bacterium RIFOXYB12_FULL_58_10]OGL98098.1 MAG: hypothetical protein A2304_03365 [Candidatus Uhrbacteria bacterium RIFOXYB2_FULL_57_15]OGM00083.1 MAG: hypothetical protein A2501_01015 [Candidatus Uhrbacteria bacterium RIFOXYC12_FULL_57_11]
MYDMITIGDTKLDTFVVLDEASLQCQLKMPDCQLCIAYGEKIVVDVVASQIAGTAPNVATGLSRMGLKTAVISNMGADGTYQLAIDTLKTEKVATRYLHRVMNEMSSYSVVLNYKGEKTLLTSHIRHAYRLPKPLPKSKWIYISEMGPGYENLYRQVVGRAKANNIHIALNPGTIQITERKTFLFDLMKKTYVLFVNLEEAQRIAEEETLEIHRLATALYKMGPKQVVITDGKRGAYAFDGNYLHFCPIFPGRSIEATGAGDAFSTGYIGALMNGQLHDEALRWGAVSAASVVGFVGPTKGLLSVAKIRSRLNKRPSFRVKEM